MCECVVRNGESPNTRQGESCSDGAMVVDESYGTCQKRNRSLSSVDPCCSVAKSNSLWSHGLQHPSPSLSPGVFSDSRPLGW